MTATVTPEFALRSLSTGSKVFASPFCGTPTTLLKALAKQVDPGLCLTLSAGMLLGCSDILERVGDGSLRFRTWHPSRSVRRLITAGRAEYVPVRAGSVPSLFTQGVDIALVRVSPPDRHGRCSLGPSASYSKSLVKAARLVIAEVDPSYPRTVGADVTIEWEDVDFFVDASEPGAEYPLEDQTPVADDIADHVLPFVDGASAVQIGIGAVLQTLAARVVDDVPGIRVVGLVNDAMVGLFDRPGRGRPAPRATAVELLGTARLFDVASENRSIRMASSRTVHDPAWLSRQGPLVAVCSALEVDLSGQAASEEVGGRVVSGIGGAVDFFEGAHLGPGGRRVVALPSTTPSGASRVSARLGPGSPVTLPRHSIDVVVTEHGAAVLTGLSTTERAEAIVEIAAPGHRPGLRAALAR